MTAPAPLTLTIFGGTGGTGSAAVQKALSRGHHVRTVDRHIPSDAATHERLTHFSADVLKDDLREFVKGADAVLSCLGVGNDAETLLSPPPLYTDGTKAIADAMQSQDVRRLIVMSASFVQSKDRGPIWFKIPAMAALSQVFAQMEEMETLLNSRPELNWTAVRPGWLMDGDATEDYTVQADVIPVDMIRTRRADVGAFMALLAENNDWLKQTPAIARSEPRSASSPEAVIDEMLG